jgi:hypothetical protein
VPSPNGSDCVTSLKESSKRDTEGSSDPGVVLFNDNGVQEINKNRDRRKRLLGEFPGCHSLEFPLDK